MCQICKKTKQNSSQRCQNVDSAVVTIFVVIFIELTNTAFANSTNTSKNIETAMLSSMSSAQFGSDTYSNTTFTVVGVLSLEKVLIFRDSSGAKKLTFLKK